jgi:ribosomal protein S18 acetylase RimI-like enzyme
VSSGPLDRPAWHALHGPQAALTTGNGAVRRLDPRYGPFACAPDAGPESLAALGALLRGPDDAIAVFEPDAWPAPPGTRVAVTVDCVQMICVDMPVPSVTATALLGEDDALAMRALAAAAEPGPWSEWTHRYGDYFGVRQGAGLLAMAGERLRPAPGLTEVSGVATAAAARGLGLGEQVVRAVVHNLAARGDTAFLHCRTDNAGAIRLYERLGFTQRRRMVVTVFVTD